MFKMLQQLNEAVSKTEQRKLMKEWRELSTEFELFNIIAKKMASRIGEIETTLLPIVKAAEGGKEVIDNAIVEYKSKKGVVSVSYSELFNQALVLATDDQKATLEAYKTSISKVGAGSESLKFCDPKLEKALVGITNKLSIQELKEKLVAIAKLPDHETTTDVLEGSVLDLMRAAIKNIKASFKSVLRLATVAQTSADKLLEIAKMNPEEAK